MRKLLSVILIMLASAVLCACSAPPVLFETIEVYDNYELTDKNLTLENEYLLLEFDCTTTQFSLTEKGSGKVWYSNPPDVEDDPIAITAIKERLQAQIVLTYGQMSGTVTEANNYTLSVSGGTYDWELTDNSIKVRYSIGKTDRVYICPPAKTESEFRELYDLMDGDQKNMMDNYYRIIDINRLRPTDNESELRAKYPEIDNERIFELRQGLQGHIMERIEEAFIDVGYTIEDLIEDSSDADNPLSEKPIFNITVIYSLDGPDFIVSVPQEEIEYRHDYPILTLTILPYFGAAGTETEGFSFVPDGSGAIINNNNGKQNQQSYSLNLYGFDSAIKRDALITENFAYMPLFGAGHSDGAFICVIEEGEASCAIEADVSGRTHSYNMVNARYTVINWDDVDISKANVVAKAFDRNELSGSLKQRYIFVSQPDYVSMATTYRNYLMERYPTLRAHNEQNLPLVLTLVGAINKTENIMGMPTERAYALTTYTEAADIIERFADADISGIRVNYTGWFNDGVLHDAPGKINLISSLGGKKDFTSLLDRAGSSGAEMFFEADFTFIHNGGLFNGFIVNRDSAKRLSRDVAQVYPFCIACYGEWSGNYASRYSHHLANTDYTMSAIDSFHTQLSQLGASNITFGSIGRTLSSDFNVKKSATRTDVMNLQVTKLSELTAGGAKTMIHRGNVYAMPFADAVINTPMDANNFNIVDESIPFYQIVFHGLVPYTGTSANLAPDYERNILKAVETGAGLQFTFMSAPGEDLLETNYSRYFAADITRWGDRPLELYHKLNNELKHTASLFITGHETLAPLITLTQYEDGTRVIVNYSASTYEYEGITVGPMDFEVVR